MENDKPKCTVRGALRGDRDKCGYVLDGNELCSLKHGECNLQAGVAQGAANGVLADTKWFRKVRAGDMLRPCPDWNRTERIGQQMPDPVEILRVVEATSQSGVVFTVRTKDGTERNLDAAWFIKPDAAR